MRGAGGVEVIYLNFRSRATISDHGHRFLSEGAPLFDHFDHLHNAFLAADFGSPINRRYPPLSLSAMNPLFLPPISLPPSLPTFLPTGQPHTGPFSLATLGHFIVHPIYFFTLRLVRYNALSLAQPSCKCSLLPPMISTKLLTFLVGDSWSRSALS